MRGGILFTFGVLIVFTGYGMLYFGVKNLLAGEQVVSLREALGLPGGGTTAVGGAIPGRQSGTSAGGGNDTITSAVGGLIPGRGGN